MLISDPIQSRKVVTSEELGVKEKMYARDIIFSSYRGAPPRAPNVRSTARNGATASKEEQQADHYLLSLLNHAIFRPWDWTTNGNQRGVTFLRREYFRLVTLTILYLGLWFLQIDKLQMKLVTKVNGQCDTEWFY